MESAGNATTVNGDIPPSSPRNRGHVLATTAKEHVHVARAGGDGLGDQSSSAPDPASASAAGTATAATQDSADTALTASEWSIPPYWSPRRTDSTASDAVPNFGFAPIRLEDRSDEDDEFGRACWARSVTIDDYVIVSGAGPLGAYVVWNCVVETMKGGTMVLRKRYSEFDTLRDNLVRAFPFSAASIPELPRKSIVSRFRGKFLEQRKAGLSHFLNCILLNPEFSGSPLVKEFVFS